MQSYGSNQIKPPPTNSVPPLACTLANPEDLAFVLDMTSKMSIARFEVDIYSFEMTVENEKNLKFRVLGLEVYQLILYYYMDEKSQRGLAEGKVFGVANFLSEPPSFDPQVEVREGEDKTVHTTYTPPGVCVGISLETSPSL